MRAVLIHDYFNAQMFSPCLSCQLIFLSMFADEGFSLLNMRSPHFGLRFWSFEFTTKDLWLIKFVI